jgi:hypothetical protein
VYHFQIQGEAPRFRGGQDGLPRIERVGSRWLGFAAGFGAAFQASALSFARNGESRFQQMADEPAEVRLLIM